MRAAAPLPPAAAAAAAPAAFVRAATAPAGASDVATGATLPAPAASTGPIPMEVVDVTDLGDDAPLSPFAEIDEVAEEGPAASAGLRVGDLLLKFGALTSRNHDGLRALARLTQRSEGDTIALLVSRTADEGAAAAEGAAGQHVRLALRPRRWAGNGLLGCHLRPL